MRIVFARTRYYYPSYSDFWKLVDLSRFDVCFVDEIDFQASDTVFITTPLNGEQPPHFANHRNRTCKLVWWFLERPDWDQSEPIEKSLNDALPNFDAVWTADRHVASLDRRFQFAVLGGHKGLRTQDPLPIEYDYTHQSYEHGRRCRIYNELRASSLREGPSGWDEARARVLASSKMMLQVHQYSMPIGAPLRYAVAAAYSLPIVGESQASNPTPLLDTDLISAGYDNVPALVRDWARREPELREYGERVHHRYCVEWPFRRGIEEAVKEFLAR